jgi:nucleoside-diphosphate-sugar epimerase
MPAIEDSRILVIGGAGFVGSHIVDQLVAEPVREIVVLDNLVRGSRNNLATALQDDRVTLVEGSIEDVDLLRNLMAGTDYVFHEANVVGTYNVIEAAHEAGVKKVVYSSSASVYGDALEVPMTEEHPFRNRTMYGATKIAGEQFFRAFHERHGLDFVGHRYMNIYGPRMDYRGTYVSVIMKVLDRIDEGQPPLIYGDGSHTYDFVHVEDVARANILSLKTDATDTFFNIGTGIPTTIRELVGVLLEITGSDIEPEYLPQEEVFVTHRVGSTELAERLLGFRAEVGLRAGLESVVDWRRADRAAAVGSGG